MFNKKKKAPKEHILMTQNLKFFSIPYSIVNKNSSKINYFPIFYYINELSTKEDITVKPKYLSNYSLFLKNLINKKYLVY